MELDHQLRQVGLSQVGLHQVGRFGPQLDFVYIDDHFVVFWVDRIVSYGTVTRSIFGSDRHSFAPNTAHLNHNWKLTFLTAGKLFLFS